MSFSPVVPVSGYAGWIFLKRTQAQQAKTFANQVQTRREEAYFRDRIPEVSSAEQLVADPRLMRIALTAFGLEGDLPNKYFIRRVLEDGTLKPEALANRLADKRYAALSKAFGFGDFSVPRTRISDFSDKILSRYQEKAFQSAVGTQNADFRLALNAETQLADLANSTASEASKWFTVLGSPPLRQVFEKAFGLPGAFAGIDIDKQVDILQERARGVFGDQSVSQFSSEEKMEKLVRLFIVRSEVSALAAGLSPAQTALTLLQQR